MALKGNIRENLKEAVKNREELKSSVLRLLLAAIFNKEKEKRYKLSKEKPELSGEELEEESQLNDEEVIEVISSEVKKRKESILEFEKGKREDLVEKEKKELDILQKYLPEQLSEEELQKLAKEAIDKTGAKEIKDMGKVMQEVMPKVKGKADGTLVSKIVKELLIPKNE
ncbi:MAG: glutamyl-tRNA amidotransferase [Candidatus Nealsonbacteria bacterium CG18_big_fil_WC_8_21_14_2_50_37_10]|uniref:Glutamyl-tRNA amidotransferase n=1 Tax=Candidatus Nealsonbacteria bacterium CG18_big_fil_WC_8_21_14_2_50_37_10 TaxID=1974717 RepID=A0A2H0FHR7_9BACT|nr:MAG: glutamyl-tRNA amidotransferase [Candidatus Nealsonbacteria bacterium CG18_big_fil_WC_8_21_14_2_50_37_10]